MSRIRQIHNHPWYKAPYNLAKRNTQGQNMTDYKRPNHIAIEYKGFLVHTVTERELSYNL